MLTSLRATTSSRPAPRGGRLDEAPRNTTIAAMTLPMALTIGRLVLAPIFFVVYALAAQGTPWVFVLWAVFILIEVSDLLDGHFARLLGQVSEIGKVLDPFADSISRITYFVCFAGSGILPVWILLILVYRDVAVSYLRVLISRRGVMLAARISGKLKAWVYGICGALGVLVLTLQKTGWLPQYSGVVHDCAYGFFLAAAAVAVWTLVDYGSFFVRFSNRTS